MTSPTSMALTTPWGGCSFSMSLLTWHSDWLSVSYSDTGDEALNIGINISASDLSMIGTTETIQIKFIATYKDLDGYPQDVTYDVDINFITTCTISDMSFDLKT